MSPIECEASLSTSTNESKFHGIATLLSLALACEWTPSMQSNK